MISKIRPIAVVLSFVFCSLCFAQEAIREVRFQGVCVQAEIADTKDKRKAGLMFRENLPENQGMLFVFDKEDKYLFWMKNMRIPLDIIYISKDKIIVDIRENVLPCKDSCEGFTPGAKAKYILEVSAGFAERNGIKIGDELKF